MQRLLILMIFIMFPLGYFESFQWHLIGPKATHGILKGLMLMTGVLVLLLPQLVKKKIDKTMQLCMNFFLLSFIVSSAFSLAPGASFLFLWYPCIAWTYLFVIPRVPIKKEHIFGIITISLLLIIITFGFAFFSIVFRYEVDNIYNFLFLPHRANFLLGEIRRFGKYVSLGPYIMLAPLCTVFLIQKKATISRKIVSVLAVCVSILTAVISNNRIDVLVIGIQLVALLFLIPRRMAIILLLAMIPITQFGLFVTESYFGFNLEERIFRPRQERDIETISMRQTYWQNALYNFKNHPIIGTGPNTYNEVTNFPLRRYYDAGVREYTVRQDYGIGVHNIFIERLSDTGLIGFFSFVILLLYFAKTDILAIRVRSGESRSQYILFSLSSWSWIFYGITDNGYGAQGFVTFFFLRGLLTHL